MCPALFLVLSFNLLIYLIFANTLWKMVYYCWIHHLLAVWCGQVISSLRVSVSLSIKWRVKMALLWSILSQSLDMCSRDKSDSYSSSFRPPANSVKKKVLLWPWFYKMVGRFSQLGIAELRFKAGHGLLVLLACRNCFCCLCRAVSDPEGPLAKAGLRGSHEPW